MFFRTIRYKILLAVCVSFLFFTVCTFVVCFVYYKNNKGMANVACSAMIEKYSTDINSTINMLMDISRNLSILGEAFYTLKNRDYKKLEKAVFTSFNKSDKIAFGGGIWYEPYSIDINQKMFGACVAYDKDKNLIIDSGFRTGQYDYLSRIWYISTKSFVTKHSAVNISRP